MCGVAWAGEGSQVGLWGAAGAGADQQVSWALSSSWASLGWPQDPQLPHSGVSWPPKEARLCRQMVPWPVPSHWLYLPSELARAHMCADISAIPKGALFRENNGVCEAKRCA